MSALDTTAAGLTNEQVLLWLDERVGGSVSVTIILQPGDVSYTVLGAEGELKHWREARPTDTWKYHPREDTVGLYEVGEEGHLDATHLCDINPGLRDDAPEASSDGAYDQLCFSLGQWVQLRVTAPMRTLVG